MTGDDLRRLRGDKMSTSELSRQLGKHRSWCSKAETGNWQIDAKLAKQITRILKLNAGDAGDAHIFNVAALKAALEKKKLSLLQLSKLVGVNSTNAYKWVNQGAQPRKATVELMAEVLEMPVDSLYVVEEAPADVPVDSSDSVDPSPNLLSGSGHVLVPMSVLTYRRLKDAIEGFEGHSVTPVSADALRALQAVLASLGA